MVLRFFATTAGDISPETPISVVGRQKVSVQDVESNEKFDYAVQELIKANAMSNVNAFRDIKPEEPNDAQYKAVIETSRGSNVELILLERTVIVKSGVGAIFVLSEKKTV